MWGTPLRVSATHDTDSTGRGALPQPTKPKAIATNEMRMAVLLYDNLRVAIALQDENWLKGRLATRS
jgi:hypothetical protein